MSVVVEGINAPVGAVTNLQTTITDLETDEEKEIQEENAEHTNDIVPTLSPRAKTLSYTKDEFLSFKDTWLSHIRPAALSDKYCNREGIWDPELWYYSPESEKRSASPIGTKKNYVFDGIVLSPQGRSFARGCQVNVEKQDGEGRNKLSGRLGRGWDAREKGPARGRNSPSGDGKFDRNFKNERNDFSGKSRRRASSFESQPEWYTYGPSSQLDTIELKGFDDVEKGNKRKKRKKDRDETANNERGHTPEERLDDDRKFDINEFFDMAENALPISGMYESHGTSSRFSQWFADERRSRSNSLGTSRSNSRRSSIADELAEIAGLTLSSPACSPTVDSEFMFAPIVPASGSCEQNNLLNIIEDSDVDVQPLLDSVIPHKTVKGAVTLEDLEGKEGISNDDGDEKEHEEKEESGVFHKLVETMKASGHLPEKPTPTIPDIPPHLLPRPPSSKDKNRATSGSRSRSPSPLQLLQEVIRRSQSPVGFVNPAQASVEPRLIPSYDPLRAASPVADILSPMPRARPLTPQEMYGAPPVFNMDSTVAASDLFEFTGSIANIDKRMAMKNKPFQSRYSKMSEDSSSLNMNTENSSGAKASASHPVISQAFVPTSVLRKLHSDKTDQKSSSERKMMKDADSVLKTTIQADGVASQLRPLIDMPNSTSTKPRDSYQSFSNTSSPTLMSPREFTPPKTTLESRSETLPRPELMTPHSLPLPRSPCVTPHSLPLPQSPLVHGTPKTSTEIAMNPLLTPHSLPLPQSPLVTSASSNPPSDLGIRPLPKTAGMGDSQRLRARGNQGMFRKPFDQRQHYNLPRFARGQMPYRGQVPVTPNLMPRPGMIPSPFNMNAARAMNVHPTALALALRNQQYQMARAAAVAAATAAVNRQPVISPAQAAAAMMLNQQRASAGFHGIMPQVNPRMFPHTPQRPSLPPALQRQHHVVHHSEPSKDNSLSRWFSDAVLNQSQSQSVAPGRGAKVLSVEELERHTCV